MNMISWVLLGLLVGILANFINSRPAQGGLFGSLTLGVLGALLGGFLGDLFFGVPEVGFNLSSFIVATVGALFILLLSKIFRGA